MYCKHCGRENDDNGTFCTYCGKPLHDRPQRSSPVNMWGEPIDDLTREFHPMEQPEQPADDLSVTRIAPAVTDLSSKDPYRKEEVQEPASSDSQGEEEEEKSGRTNRKLIIGVIVAGSALIVVLLVVLLLRLFVFSEDATPADQFEYVVENGQVSIQSYIGSSKTVVIPSRIEGEEVTTILRRAFASRGMLSVTIPDSVTSIDTSAFEDNPDLIIYGSENSYAKIFAQRSGITFAITGTIVSRSTTQTTTTATTSKTVGAVIPETTTTITTTTTTTTTTTATTTAPTYARTTNPPQGNDLEASAASLLGNTFAEVEERLGGYYSVKEGGLYFSDRAAELVFSNFLGQVPDDDSEVMSVVITDGQITEDARIGLTYRQLSVLLVPSTEWDVQPNGTVGDMANFHMAYNGEVIDVTLYFSGQGEDAHCIQAQVEQLLTLSDEDRALLEG